MPYALSEVEVFSLAALAHLGPEAYGVSIREEIERRTGRSLSVGSLYKAIHRLEKRGFVSTSVGKPTAVRGGRAKKHVQLEPAGHAALVASIRSMNNMVDGLVLDDGTAGSGRP
jgi:DNA-binding PadR family transcriptional regulator